MAKYTEASLRRLNAKFRELPDDLTRPTRTAIRRGAFRIQGAAMASVREPGTGRLYTTNFFTDKEGRVRPWGTRVPHRASAPGQPPASDTGRLLGSIEVDIRERGFVALIGSALEYARFLEFGTKKMAARPFLRPAFKSRIVQIRRDIAVEMNKALKKAGVRVT